MSARRLLLAGGALALGVLAWPIATSAMFVGPAPWATPPSLTNPIPAYFYWRDYRQTQAVRRWMPPCAAGAGLLCLLPAGLIGFVRPQRRLRAARPGEPVPEPVRARSGMHGSAHWMPLEEARRWFPGPNETHGGVVVGETPDGDLLVDPCTSDATHGLVFAGSGGGKTAGVTIPTLDPQVGWRGSAVVFDPSCEVGPMTREMREATGQRVVMLAPGGDGFNVLDWIDTSDPLAEAHVRTVIDTIGAEQKDGSDSNPMFRIQGDNIQLCILADMLWDTSIPKAERTLKAFAGRMSMPEPEMRSRLQDIYETSQSPMAKRLAGTLMGIYSKTFSGIYSNAQADIHWLMIDAYADMVSGTTMTTGEFSRGNITVYVQIPLPTLQDTPEVGRTVINALLQAVYRLEGKVPGRFLFLLDEINLLGSMKALAVARDNARKYGVTLIGMWQSLGQLSDTWKVGGKSAWMESSSWQAFAAVKGETAKEVSDRCGTYTVLAQNESSSRGSNSGKAGSRSRGRNIGNSEQARLLIRPEEIQSQLRRDERIVFRNGGTGPLRCNAALWFRRAEMLARVKPR